MVPTPKSSYVIVTHEAQSPTSPRHSEICSDPPLLGSSLQCKRGEQLDEDNV